MILEKETYFEKKNNWSLMDFEPAPTKNESRGDLRTARPAMWSQEPERPSNPLTHHGISNQRASGNTALNALSASWPNMFTFPCNVHGKLSCKD